LEHYNRNVIQNVHGNVMTQDVMQFALLFVNLQNAIQVVLNQKLLYVMLNVKGKLNKLIISKYTIFLINFLKITQLLI